VRYERVSGATRMADGVLDTGHLCGTARVIDGISLCVRRALLLRLSTQRRNHA
jgi:hypothetical protein